MKKKFNENSASGSRVVSRERMDRHSRFSYILRMRLNTSELMYGARVTVLHRVKCV
jgi:hypothetical protein